MSEPQDLRPPRLALHSGQRTVELNSAGWLRLRNIEPQSIGATYWFDAAPDGAPYTVTVHLGGRLQGKVSPGQIDTFDAIRTVDVIPGSGRIAVTARVPNLPQGTWNVTATPVEPAPAGSGADWAPIADPRLPIGTASGMTAFGPVVNVSAPGVRLGAWPALVGTGAVLALILQLLLASRLGIPVARLLGVSVVACVLGLPGAKAYYLATHPRELRSVLTSGMSVHGFVITMLATVLVGSRILDLPLTTVLDITAPGMLLGMTVGRFGCLLGGCCAGKPTKSRWGIWSSDRHLGVRRIPVQLMESALAGAVAVLALLGVLHMGADGRGLIFVAALAAYVAGRQILFRLRGIPRATTHGRVITLSLASLVAAGSLVALLAA